MLQVLGLATVFAHLLLRSATPVNLVPEIEETQVTSSPPTLPQPAPELSAATDLLQPVLPAPSRKPRRPKNHVLPRTQHQSARLAAKTKGSFVDTASQAIKRKALLNSLAGCSAGLNVETSGFKLRGSDQGLRLSDGRPRAEARDGNDKGESVE